MTPPSVESVPVPAAPCIPPAERKKGFCIRCGQPVPKRRRLYCSPECDHEFGVNHFWGMAAAEAWRRAGKVCQECGVGDTGHLVAHHIKPLAGGDRSAKCENHQDNLVMVCAS
ncbi:MAG: HNH endonuclease, partial [Chloroflexota bacterium]|nr:HNH endonuclease [Chloroflexota bacterium]